MGYELKGLNELTKELEKRLGKAAMRDLTEKALDNGAEAFDKVLIPELKTFEDTGATVDEVTYGKVDYSRGVARKIISWQGPEERYRIIHLNENGYNRNGKKVKPKGYGAIARALSKGQSVYYEQVKKTLEGGL